MPPATPPRPASAEREPTAEQASALMRSKPFVGLLVLSAIVGIVVSLAAWCFLEGTFQLQQIFFDRLPSSLGYSGDLPLWYLAIVLGIAGLIVAFAIARLPGRGGHIPAHGLTTGDPPRPIDLPGILLAAVGTIAFGLVLGPEAPLIALGTGLALLTVPPLATRGAPASVARGRGFRELRRRVVSLRLADHRRGDHHRGQRLGRSAAEDRHGPRADGGGDRQPSLDRYRVLGRPEHERLLARGALAAVVLPADRGDFAWTLALAVVIAVVVHVIMRLGRATERQATPRPFVILPVVGVSWPAWRSPSGRPPTRAPSRCCSRARTRSPDSSPTPAVGRCRRSPCS